jgi:DNA-binding beta-propeller fold protein YncE
LYGIRAMTLVVFRHPDVPIEPLVYTQTSPDVPVLVDQIEQLSINQSRSQRTAEDPTGSLSMPVVIDQGSAANGGEGSLAWPMQWYLRDHSVRWIDPTNNPSIGEDAGMVVLYTPHVTEAIRSQLEENFVQTSEGVFNWWFPEFGQAPARGYKSLGAEGVGAVLSWPFNPTNWPTLTKYMLYRELPMELDGRDMTVFVRRDLAPGAGAAASSEPIETLVPEATLPGAFNNARGLAVDAEGNMYVADALNHRIVVLDASGNEVRTIGSLGRDDGQLNEPSGVALDDDGNIYVADTWNGRIVKFASDGSFLAAWGSTDTPFGGPFTDSVTGQTIQRYATDTDGDPLLNEQNPLGFFGPRAVLVRDGRVYITDTGNSRVVVTDTDGNFIQQFGGFGQVLGQMSEPIGLGMDEQGRLFVGDTWNGRVQVFQPAADGTIDPTAVSAVQVRGWARDTYNDPYIVVAPDGTLYASQGARNTIAQYDPAQTLVRRIKTETGMDAPKGLALGVDGALYVVNSGQNAVLRFRP